MFSRRKHTPETEIAAAQRTRWWQRSNNPMPQPSRRSSPEEQYEALVRQQAQWRDAEIIDRETKKATEREKAAAMLEAGARRHLQREKEEREWHAMKAVVAAEQAALEDAKRAKAAKRYNAATRISPDISPPPLPKHYLPPRQQVYWDAVPTEARSSRVPLVAPEASSSTEQAKTEALEKAKAFMAEQNEQYRAEEEARQVQKQKDWSEALKSWRRIIDYYFTQEHKLERYQEMFLPVLLRLRGGRKQDLMSYIHRLSSNIFDAFPRDVAILDRVIAMAYKSRLNIAEQHDEYTKAILEVLGAEKDSMGAETHLRHPEVYEGGHTGAHTRALLAHEHAYQAHLKAALDSNAAKIAAEAVAYAAIERLDSAPVHIREFVFVWFYRHVLETCAPGSDADFKAYFQQFIQEDSLPFWPSETIVTRDEMRTHLA